MTDNRTTKRLMAMLEERGVKYELDHDLYVEWVDARGNDVTAFETSCKHKGDVLIVHVFLTPEQAIAATLGSDASAVRLAERLRSIAYEMRSVGASSMTPHELLACYANDVDKVADSLMFAATLEWIEETDAIRNELTDSGLVDTRAELGSELNPDGLPMGLTISDDGTLLNWRGENYVRQNVGRGTLIAEQVREAVEASTWAETSTIREFNDSSWQAIADELNAKLGSGTCELHYGEDDDGYDGWYCDECGGWFQAVRRDGHLVKPKHCQECGKAVKR